MLKLLVLMLFCSSASLAQEVKKHTPLVIVAPVHYFGIDYAERSRARAEILGSWTSFNETVSGASTFFLDNIEQNIQDRITINQRKEMKLYGASKASEFHLIEPILCRAGSNLVAVVMDSNPFTTEIYGLKSRVVAIDGNFTESLKGFVRSNPFNPLYQKGGKSRKAKSALKVGMSLAKETTRKDQGSSHCLNLLLQEQLLPKYRMTKRVGLNTNYFISRVYKSRGQNFRATRQIIAKWDAPTYKYTLPAELKFSYRWSEAVFGSAIRKKYEVSTVTLGLNGMILGAGFTEPTQDMNTAQTSLVLADSPLVSKTYRAWVYLDKGRAWGLKMNDRLVFNSDRKLTGHVVGFFGPDMRISSPKGFPVNEGAIVFVRQGQRAIKVGDSISYDQKTYP